jgi:opacity protein-like surface antigen
MAQGWFMGAGAGAGRSNISTSSQNIYYTPFSFFDRYTINQTSSISPIASVEGGYQWNSSRRFPVTYFLGLRYRYFSAGEIKGNILILNNPGFPYSFDFHTSAHTVSLFGKIDLIKLGQFSPYLSGGIGFANLRFSDYSERPLTPVSVPRNSAAFASNSIFNFSYDVGVGIDLYIKKCWSVSLGYDYVNFGTLKSGSGAYNNFTNTSSVLNLGNTWANTVFLQTDYLFNA